MQELMLKALPAGLALGVALGVAQAQTAVVSSVPVGFMKVAIKGKGSGLGVNFIGAPFVREAVYTGHLNGGQPVGAQLVDQDATWKASEFVTSEGAVSHYYVEIMDSTNAEAIGLLSDIVSHTANTLMTADDLSRWLTGGEMYCIRMHHTLGSLFGEANQVGLERGTNESSTNPLPQARPRGHLE